MFPKKQKHFLYAALLLALSVVCTTAVANTDVFTLISQVVSNATFSDTEGFIGGQESEPNTAQDSYRKAKEASVAPMFMTIIQGADEEVNCAANGLTVARFNLCGDFDDRVISLSGSYSNVSWYQLGGACTPDVNDDCPNTTVSCYGTPVSTGATFSLDASAISSANGAEFRVVADGEQFFFKVKKSNITQTYVKRDYVCGSPGRIQITNLSSAYEFSIDSGSGFGPWQGPIFDNLLDGTYIVKARLQNTPDACEYPYEPIVIDAIDMAIGVTFTDAICVGETGSITVTPTAGIGPYRYTLLDDSGTAQEFTAYIPDNPYTFAAVGFGTYTVQVETQQCQGDALNGIDPPRQSQDTSGNPIIIGSGVSALSASAEPNNSFSTACGINSVDITVFTSGGTAPYSYIVNGAGPSSASYTTSNVETVTTPGTYEFLITDANGCQITASANVEELTPPDITVAGVDGTCTNGGSRLEFTINDAKGFNLEYRADPGDPWTTNPVISVSAGTYDSIQVQYSSGAFTCIMDLPNAVTVSGVNGITGTAVKNADITCSPGGGTTGGVIEFQGPFSGGSGTGYQFSIDGVNFSTTQLYTGLAQGTYTPVIIDDSGCRRELTAIPIENIDPPTDIAFAQNNIDCTAGTSEVILTVTGPFAIATYEIISPVTINNGGNNTFVGLNTGTSYEFRATDVNGCSITENFTPIVESTIRARVKSGGDLRVCTGASDGTGTFLIDGFANNYTFNINGGTESAPQNDLEVVLPPSGLGTYTITVTDADTGCTDSTSFDIVEPTNPIALSGTVQDMSCANNNVGRVIADATGGWSGYVYTLTYPAASGVSPITKTGRTFNNLSHEGNYRLSVVDSEGCTDTFDFTLTALIPPTIALNDAASDFCYDPSTGGATVGVTSASGTTPHQYRINGGSLQPSPIFTGLTPGNYTIEVVDANNCRDQLSVAVRPQLRVNISTETEIPCGGAPGQIRVQVTGGYLTNPDSPSTPKNYEVSLDGGAYSVPTAFASNSFLYPITNGGTYVFRVTDNESCVAVSSDLIVRDAENLLHPAVDITPVSCGSPDNGRVSITPDATNGIPPYEISFDSGAFSSQTVYSNLTVGTYSYTIRDQRGCLFTDDAIVPLDTTLGPDATASPITATCSSGDVSGGISIDAVSNGSANFDFIIQDDSGNELFRYNNVDPVSLPLVTNDPILVPGNYTVVTLDANGCRDEDTVTIGQTTLTVVPDPVVPICDVNGFSNTVEIVGGVGPFLIRLENDPAAPVTPNIPPRRHTFNGLQYGVAYTVEVTDVGTGCIYFEEIPPIPGPSPLAVTASSTPAFCDASQNGEIVYEITGFTIGDTLQVELLNNEDGSQTVLETVLTTVDPYSNTTLALEGDYQIIVTNLSDDCTAATGVIIEENLPGIDVLSDIPANCNEFGQITVQGNNGLAPYEFAFMPLGSTPAPTDFTSETTFVGADGDYDVYVRDSRGCTSNEILTIIRLDPDLPAPTITVVNQCDVTATAFDITVTMPANTDTPRFTLAGDTQFGTRANPTDPWEYTYQVSSPGTYTVDVSDANGCTSQATAEVYEFLTASGGFSTMPTCNDADGVITMSVIGGSNQFSYQLQGGGGTNIGSPVVADRFNGIFTGIAPGTYQVEVTDTETSCEFTVDIQLAPATQPEIDNELKQDITCIGDGDGSIDILLRPGTDIDTPIAFILNNLDTGTEHTRNNTGSFADLPPAQYQVEVVTARNCRRLSNPIDILEPTAFSISASAPPNFVCESSANQYSVATITVTGSNGTPGTPGQEYQYSIVGFNNYQYSNTFEVVDNGSSQTFTIYAIDANGCQTTDQVTINQPTDVTPSLRFVSALDCRDDEAIEITAVGTASFTVITTGPSGTTIADVNGTTAPVLISLPNAGDYLFEVQDNSTDGCLYPLPVHTVVAPIEPVAVISEANPVICFGDSNGALFIDVTDYSGIYDYRVFEGADVAKATVLASGTFDTANFPDINGDQARITGLTAGNYYVEIISQGAPYCSSDSNVSTVRTPNGELDVQAVEIGNVSCDNNAGNITATGSGGWDIAPYEYQLRKDDELGTTPFPIEVAYQANSVFDNLTHGNYVVEIRDAEGCTDSFDITLSEITPITAGIREPQNLVCPGGNNAVLEAFNNTTGNPGAEGGVPGAGYKYQLIYLDSGDITDERSRSGLQDTPTFTGTSGGVISAGWYAIEVTSSFECDFTTAPYQVIPPPPVSPRLNQLSVPGCGGQGELQLVIENPDPSFQYEYLQIEDGVAVGAYTDLVGNEYRFLGVTGVLYQFDVRKKNASNTCDAVRSNGRTLTDATGVILNVNQIDDISCDNQNDGRIESFADGGVGGEIFTLYHGNPMDAYNPDPGATVVRSQTMNGTFEGLSPANDYYIAVRSGSSGCEAIDGPFTIENPEPIVIVSTPAAVSCNGEDDGEISVEVTSGGVGLIQFAISPNFNEFFSDPATPGAYIFEELGMGTYEILIQDESGCVEKRFVNVTEPSELVVADPIITNETCLGDNDATVVIPISGGTPFSDGSGIAYYEMKIERTFPVDERSATTPYFDYYDGQVLPNDPAVPFVTGDEYLVSMRDANGCEIFTVFRIEEGVLLDHVFNPVYGCSGNTPLNSLVLEMIDLDIMSELTFYLEDINNLDPTVEALPEANRNTRREELAGTETTWSNLPAGSYQAYIFHSNNCWEVTEVVDLEMYQPLQVSLVSTGPNTVEATAQGGLGVYEYYFQGISQADDNVFITNADALVEVRVVDELGCEAIAAIPFEFTGMLEIPNFFTPDGDTNNDEWVITGREFFPNIEVKIYDRYGRVVAVLNQLTNWDGTYEGKNLPTGDYWYVVNQNDDRNTRFVGHFTLYR